MEEGGLSADMLVPYSGSAISAVAGLLLLVVAREITVLQLEVPMSVNQISCVGCRVCGGC